MLDTALVVVSWGVVAGIVAVVNSDVAVEWRGSGCKTGGCVLRWGAMGWPGIECHCFGGAGGQFEAGEGMVVVVVDIVGIIDGGCATVVSDDVAVGSGDDKLVRVSLWGAICVTALAVVVEVVWVSASTKVVEGWGTVSVDIPASLSGCSGSSQGAVWVMASVEETVVLPGSICILSLALIVLRVVSHSFHSAVLPCSIPSFSPF